MGNFIAIDGITRLANSSMLNALHNVEEAKRYLNGNDNGKNYKAFLLNAQYDMGKYQAYMGVLEQMDFDLFTEMWNRDERHIDDITNSIQLIYQ